MRSTNVSPGFDVMRTTMRSERTRVPPVTALRSPPDSRMTGADSPVIADSSTVAMPHTMSPSPGISSPADTTTTSPRVSSDDATSVIVARWADASVASSYDATAWAMVEVRVLRSVAACALPRPSATDSARFAKSTVSHSQIAMPHVKPKGVGVPPESSTPMKGSAIAMSVVRAAPTHTRNITGLRQSAVGVELAQCAREGLDELRPAERAGRSRLLRGDGAGDRPRWGGASRGRVSKRWWTCVRRALPPGDPA